MPFSIWRDPCRNAGNPFTYPLHRKAFPLPRQKITSGSEREFRNRVGWKNNGKMRLIRGRVAGRQGSVRVEPRLCVLEAAVKGTSAKGLEVKSVTISLQGPPSMTNRASRSSSFLIVRPGKFESGRANEGEAWGYSEGAGSKKSATERFVFSSGRRFAGHMAGRARNHRRRYLPQPIIPKAAGRKTGRD